MKAKILMLITMISFICLSSFTPSKETNNISTTTVKKINPAVTITYPSDFTRLINLQLKKAEQKLNTKTKFVGPYATYFWWDFNGTQIQQSDPYWYSLDGDNWPECTAPTGNTYCEIRAQGYAYDDTIPDLTTITGIKYRPL